MPPHTPSDEAGAAVINPEPSSKSYPTRSRTSRVRANAKKWLALGEERQASVITLASALKSESPVVQRIVKRFFRQYCSVFIGSHAVDWLVHCRGVASREEASNELQLMIVGNLIREINDAAQFRDSSVSFYRFISDDNPRDGPSLAAVSRHVLAEGWLQLNLCRTGQGCWSTVVGWFTQPKWHYCVLKRHGLSYVMYYYDSDAASTPAGFVKIDNPKENLTVFYHTERRNLPSLKAIVCGDGASPLDMIATGNTGSDIDRWIRAFVEIGGKYNEPISQEALEAHNIYAFSEEDREGTHIDFNDLQGKVILIVNISANVAQTARNYSQLQRLHKEYGRRGLVILAFPCNQFDDPMVEHSLDHAEATAAQYGIKFKIMRAINVNGRGGINVPPLWEFLKARTIGQPMRNGGKHGPYIPWCFTKFLINREGNVIGRYDVGETPFSLRGEIASALRNEVPRKEQLVSPKKLAAPSTPLEAPRTFADPAKAIESLGQYYTLSGAGPFDRSPVTSPSNGRRSIGFARAVDHFKRLKTPLPKVPRWDPAAVRAASRKSSALPSLQMSPPGSPEEIHNGEEFDQWGPTLDFNFETDRATTGHLDDDIHLARRKFMNIHRDQPGSGWGHVLAIRADANVAWDLLVPIGDTKVVAETDGTNQLPMQLDELTLSSLNMVDSAHDRQTAAVATVHREDMLDTNLLTPPHSGPEADTEAEEGISGDKKDASSSNPRTRSIHSTGPPSMSPVSRRVVVQYIDQPRQGASVSLAIPAPVGSRRQIGIDRVAMLRSPDIHHTTV